MHTYRKYTHTHTHMYICILYRELERCNMAWQLDISHHCELCLTLLCLSSCCCLVCPGWQEVSSVWAHSTGDRDRPWDSHTKNWPWWTTTLYDFLLRIIIIAFNIVSSCVANIDFVFYYCTVLIVIMLTYDFVHFQYNQSWFNIVLLELKKIPVYTQPANKFVPTKKLKCL